LNQILKRQTSRSHYGSNEAKRVGLVYSEYHYHVIECNLF